MGESEKIVLDIIQCLYPEWIENQKNKYQGMEGYNQYRQIILDTFGYDMERKSIEKERSLDTSGLERTIEILKLAEKLKNSERNKEKKEEKE